MNESIVVADYKLYYYNRTVIELHSWKFKELYNLSSTTELISVLKKNQVKYLVITAPTENFSKYLPVAKRFGECKDMYFAILYESPGRLRTTGNPNAPWEKDLSDPVNLDILLSDFEYLSKTFFTRKHYFKIGGKPFVYLYDSSAFIGDVKTAIEKLRETVKATIGYDVYLVSDHVHPCVLPGTNRMWEERAREFDGVTSWLGGYSGEGRYLGGSYEEQLKILYSSWGKWAEENGKELIPFITPEFDCRYVSWGNPNSIPLKRSPEKLEERLRIALSYLTRREIMAIGTWNDFFESTTLEPSVEYDFAYLKIINKIIRKAQ